MNEQITLATPGLANQLNLNASHDSQASLSSSEGQLNITAKQELTQKTQANHNKTSGADHTIVSAQKSHLPK